MSQYWPDLDLEKEPPALNLFRDLSSAKGWAKALVVENYEGSEIDPVDKLGQIDAAEGDKWVHVEMGDCGLWIFQVSGAL